LGKKGVGGGEERARFFLFPWRKEKKGRESAEKSFFREVVGGHIQRRNTFIPEGKGGDFFLRGGGGGGENKSYLVFLK